MFLIQCDLLYGNITRFVALYLIWDFQRSDSNGSKLNPFMQFVLDYLVWFLEILEFIFIILMLIIRV